MRCIGLLGGMSWESSIEYERVINEEVRRRLGGTHSGDLIVRSFDFATIEALQEQGRWDEAGEVLAAAARSLELSGAELVVLCTNTMHQVADAIEAAIDVPFLHIGDVVGTAIAEQGLTKVALLGTRYTMEQPFLRGRLVDRFALEILVPTDADRAVVHDVIYDELVQGIVRAGSRRAYLRIIDELVGAGAEGVVAGCTEIELLVQPGDVNVPYFPTARLHALAAVDHALA